MMKNKKGTIILSIILAVQFIIPLGVWGYETYKNKELEEKGQEQKLKDALCFMEFISTEEGMRLLKSDTTTISPLNTWKINEDDMYYEIKDQITGGNSIPFVYSG